MATGPIIAVTVLSYLAGIWIAFKIFDIRKKNKKRSSKDDLLLWPLLLVVALGGGTLIATLLKSVLDLQ